MPYKGIQGCLLYRKEYGQHIRPRQLEYIQRQPIHHHYPGIKMNELFKKTRQNEIQFHALFLPRAAVCPSFDNWSEL